MVSGTTVAAGGALVFAVAAGAYFIYSKTLRLSVSETSSAIVWTAGGITPGGAYEVDFGGLSSETGDADQNGKANGSFPITNNTPAGKYEILLRDSTTQGFTGVYIQVA